MTENDEAATHEKTEGFWSRHRWPLMAAACFALLCAFSTGAYFWHQLNAPKAPPQPPPLEAPIALLNLKQVMAAHGDYARLQELAEERQALRLAMQNALSPLKVAAPEVDAKPFDDSVWQKNAQNILSQVAEIERLQKAEAARYREETRPEYEARRDELRDKYLNAALNLQLKIQNADNLQLTAETVTELRKQLDALRQERNANQYIILKAWEDEIAAYAEAAVAPRRAELKAHMEATTEALKSEALKRQVEAQARDTAALEEVMTAAQNGQAKEEELAAKDAEYKALETRILNDIAGRAAKLAMIHHYDLVIADPATTAVSLIPWEWQGAVPQQWQPVVSVDTVDITEEMIEEIKTLTM